MMHVAGIGASAGGLGAIRATCGLTLVQDPAQANQALIRRDATELRTLQHLFLVSVSSFFRYTDSFIALKKGLAELRTRKPKNTPIHVWVPGCASGEEPYTLVILLTSSPQPDLGGRGRCRSLSVRAVV